MQEIYKKYKKRSKLILKGSPLKLVSRTFYYFLLIFFIIIILLIISTILTGIVTGTSVVEKIFILNINIKLSEETLDAIIHYINQTINGLKGGS